MDLVVRDSPWLDLCWHGLALLPLPRGDASSLYDLRYSAFAHKHLRREPRTLPADAPTLARWLSAAPHGHLLQALPQLHASVEEFAEQASRPFAQVQWAQPQQQRLAATLLRHLPEALIEVFRAGLWGELRAGYLEMRKGAIGQPDELKMDLLHLACQFAGVARVDWQLCPPLRRHGRLLRGAGRPVIAIGIPDSDLQVPRYAPLLQGWHELVLLQVLSLRGQVANADPRAGQPGHAAHQQAERLALTLGARILDLPELRVPQREWLAWVLRRVPRAQVDDVVDWVASAGLLPGFDGAELSALVVEIGSALRSAT